MAIQEAHGVKLNFLCNACKAPIDEKCAKCWACGSQLDDEFEQDDLTPEELKSRARAAGVSDEGSPEQIENRVEGVETDKRRGKKKGQRRRNQAGKMAEAESEAIMERIMVGGLKPDSWQKVERKMAFAFMDPNGVKRIEIRRRGIEIRMAVDEGVLPETEGLKMLTREERDTLHYGRLNHRYKGHVTETAIDLIKMVFAQYLD